MVFVGNKKALNFIEKTLERESFSQAYLFSGPEGVGKFYLAKTFAKSLILDENLDFSSDEKPEFLADIIVISPDIEERKGIVKEREITVEKVRDARKDLALFPYGGKRKVLIVDNAHRMNTAAQNAFLKILEEPNSTTVIILVTHNDSKILPTIKSRCQKINFSLVGNEMEKEMDSVVGEDFAKKYAMLAMGRPGFLFEMAQKEEKLAEISGAYEEYEKFLRADINSRLSFAEKMSKDINRSLHILNVWIWIIREKVEKKSGPELELSYARISAIEKAIEILKNTNANSRLVLENLFINI